VLCSAALLATFLATWLKAADGSKYLFGRSLVQSSSQASFFVFGLFVRDLPSLRPAALAVEELNDARFVVIDRTRQKFVYVYFEDEPEGVRSPLLGEAQSCTHASSCR
jgi:hypothetical protein